MRTSVTGERSRPRWTGFLEFFAVVGDAAAGAAQGEGGADDDGKVRSAGDRGRASSMVWAVPERGTSRPIFTMASLKSWRSSPLLMASALAPIIWTP